MSFSNNASAYVHASGYLVGVAGGIAEGCVTFPVRGDIAFRMERRPNDRIGECAVLICLHPYSKADLVIIEDLDVPRHWHGQISIEGYAYIVRVERNGKLWAIQFLDCKQPW